MEAGVVERPVEVPAEEPAKVRTPDKVAVESVVDAVFGAFNAGDYASVVLIIDGVVREFDVSRDFDGQLPKVGELVKVEFSLYKARFNTKTRKGKEFLKEVQTPRVLRMRSVKRA
jgi:hypothetical protein